MACGGGDDKAVHRPAARLLLRTKPLFAAKQRRLLPVTSTFVRLAEEASVLVALKMQNSGLEVISPSCLNFILVLCFHRMVWAERGLREHLV